ncbi:LysE family translocator [Limobrevibacterium gyesilva]|uniref:LysE family translocator n=1 Tax=Limobrevibacterium gyesilva TaxID=2991712 RepID=A0AA41YL70_9PROT|nr:LysE family translocator [Limobrevibacterium gyesilva]MCW3474277.1 LysE family translocator [Limobrevibacterium gyesilva]
MISPSLLAASAVAGAIYTLTPGPGFLMLLGIGAAQGRRAGAGFIFGHFAGDLLWSSLALLAIVGAHAIGPLVFDVLGLVCGFYLGWLGLRAVRVHRRTDGAAAQVVRRPLLRGMAFGLTNPKGYPVAVATFTALLAGHSTELTWDSLPVLVLAASVGFLTGDCVLVLIAGAARVRHLYRRHEVWIVRASGLLFLGFAAAAVLNAAPGLRRGFRSS